MIFDPSFDQRFPFKHLGKLENIVSSGVHKPTFEPDRMKSGKYPLAEHLHQRRDNGGCGDGVNMMIF